VAQKGNLVKYIVKYIFILAFVYW